MHYLLHNFNQIACSRNMDGRDTKHLLYQGISVTDQQIYRENKQTTTDLIHWDHFEKLVALL